MQLKSSTVRDWFMFFVLVGLGAAGRWLFRDIPNFTPTAGVAVFAGLYFRSPIMAFLVPLAVMVLSNVGIQSYGNWAMLAVVYAALLFPVALSRLLSRTTGNRRSLRPMGMVACGVLPSIFFFIVTNFAVWYGGGLYPSTWAGLVTCFTQAIPFYHYTLLGDLLFVGIGLLSYALIASADRANQTLSAEGLEG
ncbi:MAG: DUF6580 family putative transport protein [Planctomycetota bacterium]|nr:DUF6580 family putative transport protein [Planctomycetota bacterium]